MFWAGGESVDVVDVALSIIFRFIQRARSFEELMHTVIRDTFFMFAERSRGGKTDGR